MYVKLYYANVYCLRNAELYGKLYSELLPERRTAADRLRFGKDRRLSVGAFALLKHALRNEGEREVPTIFLGEHGKPYFAGRENIFFNLSHSGNIALCALSDSPVGCDVEKIGDPPLSVAEKYFSPSEREHVGNAGGESERARRFYRVWTMKESFLKATGSGFTVPASSFSVFDGETFGAEWSVRGISLIRGYACAYCVKGGGSETLKIEKVCLKDLDF